MALTSVDVDFNEGNEAPHADSLVVGNTVAPKGIVTGMTC